jgi:hypothetical protein
LLSRLSPRAAAHVAESEQLLNTPLQVSARNWPFLDRGDFPGGRAENHYAVE